MDLPKNIVFLFAILGILHCAFGQQAVIKSGGIKNGNGTVWTGPQQFGFLRQNGSESSMNMFINRTLTTRPTGVCVKEVPTVSLLHDRSIIPVGNGSTPHLSTIQVCCNGYERNAHVFRKCDPICTNGCINGLCVAPEKCECFPDHVRNLADICISTCPIGCGNGDCAADGSCVCKPGYQLASSRTFCIPKCSQGCLNGNCTAPETCSCNTGYELSAENKCEPKCTGGCLFGQCVAPEQCSCLAGYEKVGNTCNAICTRGCENGQCSAPNVCSCGAGYILDHAGTKCMPHCIQNCLNGRCTAPDTCSCLNGYKVDELNKFKCLPHCANGCPNGTCSGPNFCLCKVGFVKDRSIKGSQSCVASVPPL